MNPIEKDLRSYFGITSESNILEHYATIGFLLFGELMAACGYI